MSEPPEMTGAAVLLASSAADYVTNHSVYMTAAFDGILNPESPLQGRSLPRSCGASPHGLIKCFGAGTAAGGTSVPAPPAAPAAPPSWAPDFISHLQSADRASPCPPRRPPPPNRPALFPARRRDAGADGRRGAEGRSISAEGAAVERSRPRHRDDGLSGVLADPVLRGADRHAGVSARRRRRPQAEDVESRRLFAAGSSFATAAGGSNFRVRRRLGAFSRPTSSESPTSARGSSPAFCARRARRTVASGGATARRRGRARRRRARAGRGMTELEVAKVVSCAAEFDGLRRTGRSARVPRAGTVTL